MDGELLVGSLEPLDDGHRALGQQPSDGREDALVAVDARADPEDVGDVPHHVELAVLAGDLLDATLHRREVAHDERREHHREEPEEHARDAVRRVDQDLQDDDRREEEERDQLEERDLEEPLARRDLGQLQVREDQQRC